MSADVAISQATPRLAPVTGQAPQATPDAVPPADTAGSAAASKRPLFNPSLHVDVALNLVVLQFVDDQGDVTNSIPSAKQLKAYRQHAPDTGTTAVRQPVHDAGAAAVPPARK